MKLVRLLLCGLVPLAAAAESGTASYMSPALEGKPTASGEPFNPRQLTAASYKYFRRYVRVTNPSNGKSVVVWVNDKGPAKRLHRIIDLSPAAYNIIAQPFYQRKGTLFVTIHPQ